MVDTKLYCKDCIHARISKFDIICSYLFTFSAPKSYFYKCNKFPRAQYDVDNDRGPTYVVGPKKRTINDFEFCSMCRLQHNACGPYANFWSPKKKKDLFKLLTK